MKNFDDFVDYLYSDENPLNAAYHNHILNLAKKTENEDVALAIIHFAQLRSLEILEHYHKWLHQES